MTARMVGKPPRRTDPHEIIEAFKAAMLQAGIEPPEEIRPDTPRLVRFRVGSERGRSGFYRLHADGVPSGVFGCWRLGIKETWCLRREFEVDPTAWAAHLARMAERRRAEEAEEMDRHRRAQVRARSWFERSGAADPQHPYLVKKRVGAHGIRQAGELLLIPVQDANGAIWSIQTIDHQGSKRFLAGGRKQGCFFPIGLGEKPKLILLCEGFATGATLRERTGHPIVTAFDAYNLRQAALSLRARYPRARLLICGDNDRGKATNTGVQKAREAAKALVGGVGWCVPDFDLGDDGGEAPEGTDFNDLDQLGGDLVKKQIEAAVRDLRRIYVTGGELPTVLRRAEGEMLFQGLDVYQRSGQLVRPLRTDRPADAKGVGVARGALEIRETSTEWLALAWTRLADWMRYDGRAKTFVQVDCPEKVARAYLAAAGEWRVPVLRGVSEHPTLRADGSLLSRAGFDQASGLFLDYDGPPIRLPASPTLDDAKAALDVLAQPFEEFPFATPEDRSVAVSALLTGLIRKSLSAAPMFCLNSPSAGTGKSLLADVIATVLTGRPAPSASYGREPEETEKRLSSLLLAGPSMIAIDNLERPLDGDALCSMLTQQTYTFRPLGASRVMTVPTNVLICCSGNNMSIRGDLTRRVLFCRIDAGVEHPEFREFKRDLRKWVPEHRHELIVAGLTVLRAYHEAGRPAHGGKALGSFEEWDRWVRGALIWCGWADPVQTQAAAEQSDSGRAELERIVTAWRAALGDKLLSAAEIIERSNTPSSIELREALLEVAADVRHADTISARRLGKWLERHKGRVVCGCRIERRENTDRKIAMWRMQAAAEAEMTQEREVFEL